MKTSVAAILGLVVICSACARRPRQVNPRPPRELGAAEQTVLTAAPAGFDVPREGIAHGKTEIVEYDSTTVGNKRRALVYTPPEYSNRTNSNKIGYPVLYLSHGITGDEMEWQRNGSAEVILDNLYAEKKIVPMIVVFPNGRAQPDDRADGPNVRDLAAFARFEQDLLNDLIPFMESHYPVEHGSQYRALAGLSVGGGQALNIGLNIGLGHLDTFAWVGAFSAAQNTKPPAQLIPNPGQAKQKLNLLWVSCGDQDRLMYISQRLHTYLTDKDVPHVWQVDSGGHDFSVWKNDLYLFSQRIFR